MNLKESFRYLNHLKALAQDLGNQIIAGDKHIVTQTHLTWKAGGAEDTVITVEPKRLFDCSIGRAINALSDLNTERQVVLEQIAKAKKYTEHDIDACIEIAKTNRITADTLTCLARSKPFEKKGHAQGYRINVEGNQVPYFYEIEEKGVLDYDKEEIKKHIEQLLVSADEKSAIAEKLMIETEVEVTPKYSFHDDVEAVLSKSND